MFFRWFNLCEWDLCCWCLFYCVIECVHCVRCRNIHASCIIELVLELLNGQLLICDVEQCLHELCLGMVCACIGVIKLHAVPKWFVFGQRWVISVHKLRVGELFGCEREFLH